MIRLQRVGRKHDPAFRLVAVDSRRSTKSGRFLEILGSYNPHRKTVSVKAERVKHWLAFGAKASGTVHNILVDQKIIAGKKVNVLPSRPKSVKAVEEKTDLPKSEVSV
ncbi:MAG: 30S ribosomal protein S16 [Candidatus Vogelbacteria bacterium]|nr:30S ribosomal protein S16 [Candidatus Vogelbacteria bacterium]